MVPLCPSIASRAFITRLMMAFSSWPTSIHAGHAGVCASISSTTVAGREWRISSARFSSRGFISTACGFRDCLREKASRRWVNNAPRSAAFSARPMRGASGEWGSASSRLPMITASRLLKSCASPPVSCPTAFIFWLCSSASSSPWRSRRSTSICEVFSLSSRVVCSSEAVLRAKTLNARASSPSSSRLCSAGTETSCSPWASRDIAREMAVRLVPRLR